MSDLRLSEPALTAGLLMEGAQSQQQLAAAALTELRAHTAGLDGVVRDEIHRTLVEGLAALSVEVAQVTRRVRTVGRRSRWRAAGACLAMSAATLAPFGAARWWLPSPSSVTALAEQETQLRASLARLRQQGAGVQLRQCGSAQLCVRINPQAPRFGEHGEFAVLGRD